MWRKRGIWKLLLKFLVAYSKDVIFRFNYPEHVGDWCAVLKCCLFMSVFVENGDNGSVTYLFSFWVTVITLYSMSLVCSQNNFHHVSMTHQGKWNSLSNFHPLEKKFMHNVDKYKFGRGQNILKIVAVSHSENKEKYSEIQIGPVKSVIHCYSLNSADTLLWCLE